MLEIIYSIASSPNFANDGVCFAASHSGLYKSEDGGVNWNDAYRSLNPKGPLTTTDVAVSPNFEKDQTVFSAVGGAVLFSSDGGNKWNAAYLDYPEPNISCIAVSPNFEKDGVVVAGTIDNGVYISEDRGRSWKSHNFGLIDLSILCVIISKSFAEDETIFVGTETGVFLSRNGGRAWKETNFFYNNAPVVMISLSPNFIEDNALFVGTETSGLFYSGDRGTTWIRLGKNRILDEIRGIILSNYYPNEPDILVAFNREILISHDNGKTWKSWKEDISIDDNIMSISAPLGIEKDMPIIVGYEKKGILRI